MKRHQDRLLVYRRYLDDVFGVICAESESAAMTTLQEMNHLHPDMKLSFELSPQEAKYLDLHIFKGSRFQSQQLLDTTTHFKVMNPFLYIHYRSYHSRAQKLGFIKAELIRFCRNSSSLELFMESVQQFYHRLLRRGYPRSFLSMAFNQVQYTQRSHFLSPPSTNTPAQPLVVFKVLRNPVTTAISWPSLLHPPLISSDSRVVVAWKLPPSLGNHLVRSSH